MIEVLGYILLVILMTIAWIPVVHYVALVWSRFTTFKDHPMNWRFWSIFHFWDRGYNGYYAWLDRNHPGWWRRV